MFRIIGRLVTSLRLVGIECGAV